MFQLIIFVTFLSVLTFAWKPARQARQSRVGTGPSNPFQGRYKTAPKPNNTIDKGSMTRCHNCSCFFPGGEVVHEIIEGHLLEFCSQNCRNNFVND